MTAATRLRDWLEHAKGNRRRAHEYRRWAMEYEPGSPRYEHYRKVANRSWRMAWEAISEAKLHRELGDFLR
jgi:hypothetical protein